MKKIQFTIIGLISLLLFSCNPNKEIYKELDAMRVPYNDAISYKLTDDDYTIIKNLALEKAENADDSAMAENIDALKTFTATRLAANYIPDFLESKFLALDSASSVSVTYNYDNGFIFTDEQKLNFDDTVSSGTPDCEANITALFPNPDKDDRVLVQYIKNTDGSYDKMYVLYQYNGLTWVNPNDDADLVNAFNFSRADYALIGGGTHIQGTLDIPHTLSNFFRLKFPYANAGDEYQVTFKYGTKFEYNKCFFNGTNWYVHQEKVDQFVHTGTKWVFDPTVNFTMAGSDYQIIVDWVIAQDTLPGYDENDNGYVGYDARREFYFGANAKYSDFNMNLSERLSHDPNGYLSDLSEDEAQKVIDARLERAALIVLEGKYPNAVPFVNGVPVYYNVQLLHWTPGVSNWYTYKYLCTDVGTFEFVESALME